MPFAEQSNVPSPSVMHPTKSSIHIGGARESLPLYPDYLPHYDPLEQVDMVGPFEHDEPGLRANPSKPNLLATVTKIEHLSPYCGTELHGIQLVSMTSITKLLWLAYKTRHATNTNS